MTQIAHSSENAGFGPDVRQGIIHGSGAIVDFYDGLHDRESSGCAGMIRTADAAGTIQALLERADRERTARDLADAEARAALLVRPVKVAVSAVAEIVDIQSGKPKTSSKSIGSRLLRGLSRLSPAS